jgi:hypothetical protein
MEAVLQCLCDQAAFVKLVQELDEEEMRVMMAVWECSRSKNTYRHFDHPSTWAELRERFPPEQCRWDQRFRLSEK